VSSNSHSHRPPPETRIPIGSELSTGLEPVIEDAEETRFEESSASRTSPVVRALWAHAEGARGVPGQTVHDSIALPSWRQYEDLQLLGDGGMGRIFRAFDPSLKRPVALKFLRREAPELIARFVLEAQHQAMVDHPNVCKVYEVGEWQGQSYIAMQFIDGNNLELAREELCLMDKVEVIETVAEAIHVAHRQGLIHRDLKPANIMVERSEEKWKPFVLDFGLARGMNSAGLTEHGFVFGTAHYMAPEQARGEVERVGRRTDVYALGATLYKLLTGDPPFPGKDALDCMRRTVEDEAPPIRKIAPEVPADLETIVMKCIEKVPELRYESARALAEDLRRFRDGEPILSHPPTILYRIRKKAKKHKALFGVSALAILAVLLFAGIGIQARVSAAARAQWAQHFGQQAEQIEALIRYTHLLPAHDIRPELAQVREQLQLMERDAAKSGTIARGPAAYALGRGHLALGEPTQAKELLERAWGLGFRAPEVSYALGRAYGALYQQELERTRRIAESDLREARLREIEKKYRDPSLIHLRAGGGTTLEPATYRDALLAFYDQKYDEALAKAREAHRARPWFYEALRLEGDILLAKASAATRAEEIEELLSEAVQPFKKAQAIAPSDTTLLLGEARCWRQKLDQGWWQGEFPLDALHAGLRSCIQAQGIDPDLPDAYALEAWLQVALIRSQSNQKQEIGASVQEARVLAEKALSLNPGHLEALVAQVSTESRWAKALWFSGRDPLDTWKRCFLAGERALQVDPVDVSLLNDLSHAHLQCMVYKARKGMSYRADWEASAALMERAVHVMPDNYRLQESLGSTYMEWAEQEYLLGHDPAQAVQKSIAALKTAISLNPTSARTHYILGCVYLIQGGADLAQGKDPTLLLDQAIAAEEKALREKPDYSEALVDQAQCHLLKAKYFMQSGESPEQEISSAWALIDRMGAASHQRDFTEDLAAAECALVELEWILQAGRRIPMEGRVTRLFGQAESCIQASLKKNADRDGWITLAKLCELRTRLTNSASVLAKGIDAAERAISLDPQYGESYFYLGALQAKKATGMPGRLERDRIAQSSRASLLKAASMNATLKTRAQKIASTLVP